MTHPNLELMRRYSAALQAGQAADALPFYAEDLVLHLPGRSPHAGTFLGQDAVRGERTLDVDRVVVYRIVDSRIAEIWVRDWDQYAYDEFFADVQ